MKKIVSLLLTLVLLCTVLIGTAAAADIETGKLGDNVTFQLDLRTGILTLSGTGPTWSYSEVPDASPGHFSPFCNDSRIRKVVVCDGVTELGDHLFSSCENLQVLVLAKTVRFIGMGAVRSCDALEAVYCLGDAPEIHTYAQMDHAVLYRLPGTAGWDSDELSGYSIRLFSGAPYSDVPYDAWYAADVVQVYQAGWLHGTGMDRFSPLESVTRAQLVTALYRRAGQPQNESSEAPVFSDVAAGRWYSDAVAWAASRELVNGYPDGTFRPNRLVSREELATILYRSAYASGWRYPDLRAYSDAASVAPFAQTAMSWAVGQDIVRGVPSGNGTALQPKASATRAQLAAMLVRYEKLPELYPPVPDA